MDLISLSDNCIKGQIKSLLLPSANTGERILNLHWIHCNGLGKFPLNQTHNYSNFLKETGTPDVRDNFAETV